jgi:hypothetical protein
MVVKYSHVHKEDFIATRIDEGKYAGIVYQVGRIQFSQPDKTGHRAMRFKYQILQNSNDVEVTDDIMSIIGDIIVDQMEKQLEKGELVYANGTD